MLNREKVQPKGSECCIYCGEIGQKGVDKMGRQIALEGGGTLTVREEGVWVVLEAARPDDRLGLYKVWLWGLRGKTLMGTLTPTGGQLRLSRRVSRTRLEQEGCWPVTGGETVMAYAFVDQNRGPGQWRWEENPAQHLRDPVLVSAARRWGGMYLRWREREFQLAVEYSTQREFPLAAAFCLAKIQFWENRQWVVFDFDENGNPKYK